MAIYKYPKYFYYVFLVYAAYSLNQQSSFAYGMFEYIIIVVMPIFSLEGVSFHFSQTEKEFGPSKKRLFTRVWYLLIIVLSALAIFKVDPTNQFSFALLYLPLVIPFIGFAFYMGFFPLYMLFEKTETEQI